MFKFLPNRKKPEKPNHVDDSYDATVFEEGANFEISESFDLICYSGSNLDRNGLIEPPVMIDGHFSMDSAAHTSERKAVVCAEQSDERSEENFINDKDSSSYSHFLHDSELLAASSNIPSSGKCVTPEPTQRDEFLSKSLFGEGYTDVKISQDRTTEYLGIKEDNIGSDIGLISANLTRKGDDTSLLDEERDDYCGKGNTSINKIEKRNAVDWRSHRVFAIMMTATISGIIFGIVMSLVQRQSNHSISILQKERISLTKNLTSLELRFHGMKNILNKSVENTSYWREKFEVSDSILKRERLIFFENKKELELELNDTRYALNVSKKKNAYLKDQYQIFNSTFKEEWASISQEISLFKDKLQKMKFKLNKTVENNNYHNESCKDWNQGHDMYPDKSKPASSTVNSSSHFDAIYANGLFFGKYTWDLIGNYVKSPLDRVKKIGEIFSIASFYRWFPDPKKREINNTSIIHKGLTDIKSNHMQAAVTAISTTLVDPQEILFQKIFDLVQNNKRIFDSYMDRNNEIVTFVKQYKKQRIDINEVQIMPNFDRISLHLNYAKPYTWDSHKDRFGSFLNTYETFSNIYVGLKKSSGSYSNMLLNQVGSNFSIGNSDVSMSLGHNLIPLNLNYGDSLNLNNFGQLLSHTLIFSYKAVESDNVWAVQRPNIPSFNHLISLDNGNIDLQEILESKQFYDIFIDTKQFSRLYLLGISEVSVFPGYDPITLHIFEDTLKSSFHYGYIDYIFEQSAINKCKILYSTCNGTLEAPTLKITNGVFVDPKYVHTNYLSGISEVSLSPDYDPISLHMFDENVIDTSFHYDYENHMFDHSFFKNYKSIDNLNSDSWKGSTPTFKNNDLIRQPLFENYPWVVPELMTFPHCLSEVSLSPDYDLISLHIVDEKIIDTSFHYGYENHMFDHSFFRNYKSIDNLNRDSWKESTPTFKNNDLMSQPLFEKHPWIVPELMTFPHCLPASLQLFNGAVKEFFFQNAMSFFHDFTKMYINHSEILGSARLYNFQHQVCKNMDEILKEYVYSVNSLVVAGEALATNVLPMQFQRHAPKSLLGALTLLYPDSKSSYTDGIIMTPVNLHGYKHSVITKRFESFNSEFKKTSDWMSIFGDKYLSGISDVSIIPDYDPILLYYDLDETVDFSLKLDSEFNAATFQLPLQKHGLYSGDLWGNLEKNIVEKSAYSQDKLHDFIDNIDSDLMMVQPTTHSQIPSNSIFSAVIIEVLDSVSDIFFKFRHKFESQFILEKKGSLLHYLKTVSHDLTYIDLVLEGTISEVQKINDILFFTPDSGKRVTELKSYLSFVETVDFYGSLDSFSILDCKKAGSIVDCDVKDLFKYHYTTTKRLHEMAKNLLLTMA